MQAIIGGLESYSYSVESPVPATSFALFLFTPFGHETRWYLLKSIQ